MCLSKEHVPNCSRPQLGTPFQIFIVTQGTPFQNFIVPLKLFLDTPPPKSFMLTVHASLRPPTRFSYFYIFRKSVIYYLAIYLIIPKMFSDELTQLADDLISELTTTKEEFKTKVSDILNSLL